MPSPNAYRFGPKIGPKSDPNCKKIRSMFMYGCPRFLVADNVRSGECTDRPPAGCP